MDELAAGDTFIHRLDPTAKLIVTLTFIVVVVSFDKYTVTALLPFLLYPVVLAVQSELPIWYLAKRVLIAAPFVMCTAIFNPVFDHGVRAHIGTIGISGGWISFVSILIKYGCTLSAALILAATTGMNNVAYALSKLRIPRVFVIQLLFMYRYVAVLIEETARVVRAYALRSSADNGVRINAWGSLVGQLLLRTYDRAQRIYRSMLSRGFDGRVRILFSAQRTKVSIPFLMGWISFFILARIIDIPFFIGRVVVGGPK